MTPRTALALAGILAALVALPPDGGASGAAPPQTYPVASGWASHSGFADGKAEVNTYRAVLHREGADRETRVYTILVAEDLDPGILVKADDWKRPGLLRAFKYAVQADTQVGMARYRESVNVFFQAAGWRPVKLVHAHEDWCGITSEIYENYGGRKVFRWTSYWEKDGGFGERTPEVSADAVPADALPAWVRGLDLHDGLAFDVELLPSLEGSKVPPFEPVTAPLTVTGPVDVTVPAGTFPSWEVRIGTGPGTFEAAVEAAFPNRVVRWTDGKGQTFALEKSQRSAYWEKNAPGDESLLRP
jgi:hypothetical protein